MPARPAPTDRPAKGASDRASDRVAPRRAGSVLHRPHDPPVDTGRQNDVLSGAPRPVQGDARAAWRRARARSAMRHLRASVGRGESLFRKRDVVLLLDAMPRRISRASIAEALRVGYDTWRRADC